MKDMQMASPKANGAWLIDGPLEWCVCSGKGWEKDLMEFTFALDKAFDMVLPNILATKLKIYGFTGDEYTLG